MARKSATAMVMKSGIIGAKGSTLARLTPAGGTERSLPTFRASERPVPRPKPRFEACILLLGIRIIQAAQQRLHW